MLENFDPETNGESKDIVADNIAQLKHLFPEVFAEDKIDFTALQAALGKYIETSDERYNFTWHGKAQARRIAQTPSTGTLRPCKEESKDWDTTQNLFIEGDNLEVLKLLQKSYHKQVKMIYIDPPYNTGKEFIYPDNYQDNLDTYLEYTGQKDSEGRKFGTNAETSGRYHTNWLNMMYPRLKLARNLLRDDGVIFISIDDEEQSNLKKLCDEIFGEENYINTVSINMKNIAGASGGGEDKRLKKNIEYLHIYTKNYDEFPSFENVFDHVLISELVEQYRDDGKSWKYTSILVQEGEKVYIGSTVDGDGNEIKIFKRINPIIKSVNQVMRDESLTEDEVYSKYSKQIFQTAMPQSSIRPRVMDKAKELGSTEDLHSIEYVPKTGRNKGVVYEQFYKGDSFRLFAWLRDVSEEIDGQLYKKEMQGTYWDFASETKNLSKEGSIAFPNGKKPLKMLKRLLKIQGNKNSIVLDFFAGSASMAHAVLDENVEDSGDRRFIMVQLPEKCDEKSDLYKEGFRNIADVGKERINRAITKLKKDNPDYTGDLGYKVFKLDSSNIKLWDADFGRLEDDLYSSVDNIKEDRSSEDVLFELLLKYGIDLTIPIENHTIGGKKVYSIGLGALLICLDDDITLEVVEGIGKLKEELQPETVHVVLKDAGLKDDVVKTNTIQLLKRYNINDVKTL
ncbi:MAG: site-specific DNA-methyltransferase [Methylophaga sp.]|nr:site-specific DNA-methyltransferase [Methylophaga sp.]